MSTASYSSSPPATPVSRRVLPDFVRVLLLNHDYCAVLMVSEGSEWDLPYFEYSKSIPEGDTIKLCCRDFSHWFGFTSKEACFTAIVELLGFLCVTSKRDDKRVGQGKLLVMDSQLDICIDELILLSGAEWKNASFLSGVLKKPEHESLFRIIMKVVLGLMQPHSTTLASISDPRNQRGWFGSACEFLWSATCTKDEKSDVVQEHKSYTLLSVTASRRQYFSKSWTLGCNEGPVTEAIGYIFPSISSTVVGISPILNCFVSERFWHVATDMESVFRTLGYVQLKSRLHFDLWKDAGVPVRTLEGLEKKM